MKIKWLITVSAMLFAVALFSVPMLANGLSASPQESRPYLGDLDLDPLWSSIIDPPAPPPVTDTPDIDPRLSAT